MKLHYLAVILLLLPACDSSDRGGPAGGTSSEAEAPVEGSAAGSGAPCPEDRVPRVRPEVRAVAFPRGEGPVFVGLGTGRAVHYAEDTRQDDGWYYYKTLWAVSPGYAGAVKITGYNLEGADVLRFNAAAGFPGNKQISLHFPPSEDPGWRYGPSFTLIRAPGCYQLEIRGQGFTELVTFRARP